MLSRFKSILVFLFAGWAMLGAGIVHAQTDRGTTAATSSVEDRLSAVQIAIMRNDHTRAIALAERLVADAPNLIVARRLLVGLLLGDGRVHSAQAQLRILQAMDHDPVRTLYYAEALRQIERNNLPAPYFDLELVPDNNINRASDQTEQCWFALGGFCTQIPAELHPQSGLRLSPRAGVRFSRSIADHHWLGVDLEMAADLFSVETLDSYRFTVAPYWRYQNSLSRVKLRAIVQRELGDNLVYSVRSNTALGMPSAFIEERNEAAWRLGGTAEFGYALGPNAVGSIEVSQIHTRFDDQNNFDYLNSITNSASIGLRYRLSSNALIASSLTKQFYNEQGNGGDAWHRDYDATRFSFGLENTYKSNWVSGVGLSLTKRDYDGISPYSGTVRTDIDTSVNFSLANKDWDFIGTTPKLDCSLRKNASNVPNYEIAASVGCGVKLLLGF